MRTKDKQNRKRESGDKDGKGGKRTWSENWTFLGLPKSEMRSRHYRFQGELESALSDLGARINPGNQKMTI